MVSRWRLGLLLRGKVVWCGECYAELDNGLICGTGITSNIGIRRNKNPVVGRTRPEKRKRKQEMHPNKHRTQLEHLWKIRSLWFEQTDHPVDHGGKKVTLDGSTIDGIPSLFMALGYAVNGPGGYFGACLDSLSDCMCGGFGVKLPFRVRIVDADNLRERLDWFEWFCIRAEHQEDIRRQLEEPHSGLDPKSIDTEIADIIPLAQAGKRDDVANALRAKGIEELLHLNYFDKFVSILRDRGATVSCE